MPKPPSPRTVAFMLVIPCAAFAPRFAAHRLLFEINARERRTDTWTTSRPQKMAHQKNVANRGKSVFGQSSGWDGDFPEGPLSGSVPRRVF